MLGCGDVLLLVSPEDQDVLSELAQRLLAFPGLWMLQH
jgi:hypothetical protein